MNIIHETAIEALEKGDCDVRRAMASALRDDREERGAGAYFLGTAYAYGEHGFPKDLRRARRWYGLGSWFGNAYAATNLGHAYAHGEGGRQSYRLANLCYKRAIRGGCWIGMGNYAFHLWKGLGTDRDPAKAAQLYHDCIPLAGEAGEIEEAKGFMLDYATLCEEGDGIPKDMEMAIGMRMCVKILENNLDEAKKLGEQLGRLHDQSGIPQ